MLCAKRNDVYLARLLEILVSANSDENYRRYNFQDFPNMSGIFRNFFSKISGNIKFPENSQAATRFQWPSAYEGGGQFYLLPPIL